MREPRTGRVASRQKKRLERFLQDRSRLEADGLAGLDPDLFAGLRIAAHTRLPGPHAERPETGIREALILPNRLCDVVEHGVHDFVHGSLRKLPMRDVLYHLVHQLSLRH